MSKSSTIAKLPTHTPAQSSTDLSTDISPSGAAALAVQDIIERAKKPTKKALRSERHYVLDTNVLLHDPLALFQFDEHTLYLPMVVLEELDKHKKGFTDLARNARQVSRALDELLQAGSLDKGFDLSLIAGSRATGRLYIVQPTYVIAGLAPDVPDNQILSVAHELSQYGRQAVLVSNDINLRVKALANGVLAQGYRSDRVLSDEDVLPSGFLQVDFSYWEDHQKEQGALFWLDGAHNMARITNQLPMNSFLVESTADLRQRAWRVVAHEDEGCILREVHLNGGRAGVLRPRNIEQAMALDLLKDPDLDVVTLLGAAGTGKTLLAVAAGIDQVHNGRYESVLITRATVPMGEEIGFLPGDEQDKMSPWLGGTLRDVLSALKLPEAEIARAGLEVASMSFMRGRSFHNKYIVVDEAQNLTASQVRALLTRAAEGSKVILNGNLGQIDTPYLDQGNSGLTWAVTQLYGWPHGGHLILPRGERSRLASFIEEKSAYRGT